MAQDLIAKHATYDQFIETYVSTVEDARAIGHVGLKSIIAYRTGLAIRQWDKEDIVRTWSVVKERAQRAGHARLADKPLNDQLVLLALDVAARQELPIQFHTGLGDNDLDMLYANPLHLRPLFEDSRYQRVPFVLLHASYPYVRELGYLASLYSNVWMDLGLAIPYATIDIPSVWRQALSLTPFSKILFSTDAYSVPEVFWLAARWGRWGLSTVLDEAITLGALSYDEAIEAAEHILHKNSSQLYQVAM
jgi:predicted TIM-barrel fold metal-dependent hydrolase